MVRLQKFLADAGLASRRASEQIIRDGRVEVNGEVVRQLGTRIEPGRDTVRVDGRTLKPKRKLHVAIHKPRGVVCSRRDPAGRRTLHDLLPREWSNLYSVGRLDYESEGLIFATNDGEFCLRLTHPRYGVRKKYLVTVEGLAGPEVPARLRAGVVDAGERLRAAAARILKANRSHSLLEIELAEGRNRELRRLLERLGFTVARLLRVQIGPIKLGELPVGKWRTLTDAEIKSLMARHDES